jgi:uncharacterized protein (TIGR03086 family)
MIETVTRFEESIDTFDAVMHQLTSDQLGRATPCAEWDVRALVNHVVGETAWVEPLLAGRTIVDVGDTLSGDLLGADACAAWHHWSGLAHTAFSEPGATARTVHLSYGDENAGTYCDQLTFDLLVHSWDLARGIRADDTLPGHLVAWARRWFGGVADQYRGAGIVDAAVRVAPDADEQTRLLALAGRRAEWRA